MAEAATKDPKLAPVFVPGLGTRMVPLEDVAEAATSGGARLATEPEYRVAKREADYGGIGGALAATGVGAVRGAGSMFGIPTDAVALSFARTLPGRTVEDDPYRGELERNSGDRLREALEGYNENFPVLSKGGEIVGAAATTLLGGGLVKGVGKLGGAAAAAELGLGRAGVAMAKGATEGALYEASKTANEAALKDEPLTVEKIVAGMARGGLLGMVTGVAFEGSGLVKRVGHLAERAADRAHLSRFGKELGEVAEGVSYETGKAALESQFSDESRRSESPIGGPGGGLVADDDLARQEMLRAVDQRTERAIVERARMLDVLDKTKSGIAPNPDDVVARIETEVIRPLSLGVDRSGRYIALAGAADVVAAAEEHANEIRDSFINQPPTFGRWDRTVRDFANRSSFVDVRLTPVEEVLSRIDGIMSSDLDAASDRAVAAMGDGFEAPYRANEKTLQSLGAAKKLAEIRGTSDTSDAVGSPTTTSQATSSTVGRVADLLGRIDSVLAARRIAAHTEAHLQAGAVSLVGSTKSARVAGLRSPGRAAPLFSVRSGQPRADYEKALGRITDACANVPATMERLTRTLGDLPKGAPKLANAITMTSLAGLNYLAQKCSPSKSARYSLQPQLQRGSNVSDTEISKFMCSAEAVVDPLVLFREAKRGTLTRDHVEAVKAVYPNLYDLIRGEIMRNLIVSRTPLPYTRRIQLGILLELPTDATLAPDFLRAIQATYSSDEKAGAESPPPNLARTINVAGSVQTATQAAAERIGP